MNKIFVVGFGLSSKNSKLTAEDEGVFSYAQALVLISEESNNHIMKND